MITSQIPPPPFRLTAVEIASSTWARLKQHMEEERQRLRIRNDGDLTETETARVRGAIRQLTVLLDLEKPPPDLGE